MLATWQTWDEANQDDDGDVDALSISSATFVNILDTSQTAYDRTLPGWIVAGSHAHVHHLGDAAYFETFQIWGPDASTLHDPYTITDGTNDGTTYDATYDARNFGATTDDIQWSNFYDMDGNPSTFCAWVRVDDLATEHRIFLAQNAAAQGSIFIGTMTDGSLRFWHEHTGGGSVDLQRRTAASVISVSTWHHVVVSYEGGPQAAGVRIYVDGSETSYTTTTSGAGTPRDAQGSFGLSYSLSAAVSWLGDIADARMYSRILTATEIANIHADGLDADGAFAGPGTSAWSRAAVIPGRTLVEARLTGAATLATVRIQSGEFEWVDHAVTSTSWTVLNESGFFETQVTPDHAWAVVQVFAEVDANTVEIRSFSAGFGE